MAELADEMNAYTLAINYGFMPRIKGKYEPFIIGHPTYVFRLANRQTSDNIMIKFNAEEITPPE